MLQWMGGSRKKVSTSRKCMQKRQKQYFEQRKRQQQYQQQTERLESYDDRMDISALHHKEHRSLDVMSLLTLSTIAQESKSACPSKRKDLGVNASKMEFGITNYTPVVLSDKVVPADSVESLETRIASGFHVNTASPNKISSSAPDNHKNSLSGVSSKPDQWNTTAEHQLSVLDLLCDDGLNGNTEESTAHEAHVAFSVEGLGKVGSETPVHSPQQPNRTVYYGFSPSPKAARRMKLSKKFNSSLDELGFGMDEEMKDIDLALERNPLEFSSDLMDSLSSLKQRSFTVREARQHDNYGSKKNSYFGYHNEDEWDDRTSFQYQSFFDEREPDISRKTRKHRNEDHAADKLIYRDCNLSDFAFDDPCLHVRTTAEATNKFDVLGSTFSFSEYAGSKSDCDFLIPNRERHPNVEKKFDFKSAKSKQDRFSFMTEDAKDDSSSQSEESCSSTAVRCQGTDTSPSFSVSRQGRRRGQGSDFNGAGDEYVVEKAFAKESKDDVQQKNIASGKESRTNMLNSSELKSWHHSSSFSRENLGTRDIWFEEGYTTVDINPRPSSFYQNSGEKDTLFDSEFWGEYPFSKLPTPKSHNGANPLGDEFNSEPVACSPSNCFIPKKIPQHDSSPISKPDFLLNSELRNVPQGSYYTVGFQGETPSPDLSARESVSKDVEDKVKFEKSDFCESFELGEETCISNESLVSKAKEAIEASNLKNNEPREAKKAVLEQMEKVNTTVPPEPVEETGTKDEMQDHHNDNVPLHWSGRKGNIEDFAPKGRMGSKPKSDFVDSSCQEMMLQSYVFQFFCVHKRLKY